MSGNKSGSSYREKSPFLMRSNDDLGRRSKEVSPKVGEPLKEHLKRKRPKSRSKSSNEREALMKKKSLTEKAIKKVEETTSI